MPRDPVRISPASIVHAGLCIGCGSCAARPQADPGGDAASVAHMRLDALGELRPTATDGWMREGPRGFARICPFSPEAADEDELAHALFGSATHGDPRIGRFERAYVGHVAEDGFRLRGSSGGMAGWTAAELLRLGLVDAVAHVLPVEGSRLFRYGISRSPQALAGGAKSRYYPVEMSQVLREIRETPGRYAVVGVPCFVKAVQLLRREDALMRERIAFTLGLFCGHMKSSLMVESFARQVGVAPRDILTVDFRLKDPSRPANRYTLQITLRDGRLLQRAWFHLIEGDWGSGFLQNPACNFCDDVVAETADISFGDAWVEPHASDWRGTNVVIARSPELAGLVEAGIAQGRLALSPVDADFIARTQAAGLRQRREGLAYRLAVRARGLRPRKRVQAGTALPWRRRLIYRTRAAISRWSRPLLRAALALHAPWLYAAWGRAALAIYHGLAYGRGRLGRALWRVPALRPPPDGTGRGMD